ncbi:recombinase family protein [Shewanella sp. 3_MG-2023]|uniref:recombinase family protein n=1 Tax=Shewanella sp. 3_MG-2023 TaxID=3062635 RepID=UPI0026E1DAB9|nr:recombinase family protein [Shewanella sp. 3_MG-2023]MDO6776807.1 recombinase family protein [Shewanella sp. 3_MG-2023]
MPQIIGYIRVSTVDQNTVRQLDGINLDQSYTDTCSGSTVERPKLNELKSYCRSGDTVVVHDISRLARNIQDLISLIKFFNNKGVTVEFKKEAMTFTAEHSNPMNTLMLNLLGSVYQFEREMMLERQREGIAKAKSAGKYKGRPLTVEPTEVIALLNDGLSIRKVANQLGISTTTVQKIKKMT